jgi:hypothetical protein
MRDEWKETNLVKLTTSFSTMFKPIVLRNWHHLSLIHISNAWKALVMKWMIGKRILWQIVPDISEPKVLRKSHLKTGPIHPRGF